MTREEIQKAFEGRWRVKAQNITTDLEMMLIQHRVERVKEMCLDFFEAGVAIGRLSEEQVKKENTCATIATDTKVVIDGLVPPPNKTLFGWWWDLYDKKIDRGKCEKKFEKLTTEEKKACIAATPAYVASTPDIQFRRHPMTYLNNKSWENQIIPRNNGTNKPTIEQQRIDKLADVLAG